MNIFDIHCDTAFEIFRNGFDIENEYTSVSLSKLALYENKFQVFAFWSSDDKSSDECFYNFKYSSAYFDEQAKKHNDKMVICNSAYEIDNCKGRLGAVKCVEGARLLGGDLSRLSVLYQHGVRVLIPVWSGIDNIGGAWDTDDGLTDFGKELIAECERLGIIVDVSHMSEKSFWDTVQTAKKPFIASHSNSRALCNTPRNLTDIQFRTVLQSGGIVGMSLAAKHVSSKYFEKMPNSDDDFIGEVAGHILHYLELSGEKSICLGCDFDGTEKTALLPDVSAMHLLYDRLIYEGVDEETVKDIFYGNAYRFFTDNL